MAHQPLVQFIFYLFQIVDSEVPGDGYVTWYTLCLQVEI